MYIVYLVYLELVIQRSLVDKFSMIKVYIEIFKVYRYYYYI